MGAIIRSTGVSLDASVGSSIDHAAIAAKACLESAGVRAEDVSLMINAGIYRDSNMVEPAMSALIQRKIGMNLDHVKHPVEKPGFSFDLMNGACGVLNAVQVASASLALGDSRYALIVASDAHPSGAIVPEFPYAATGAAMLLEHSPDSAKGFGRLTVKRGAKSSHGVRGYLDIVASGTNGRNLVTVEQDADYEAELLELVAACARTCATQSSVALRDALVIAPHVSPKFPELLARRLEIAPEAVPSITGVDRDPHSSTMILGYHQAAARGDLAKHAQVLFAAGGAGLSSACIAYRA